MSSLKEKLRGVFPFMEKEPGFAFRSEGALLRVTFYDYYAIALHFGYEELISGCPKELCDRWSFNVEH